MRKIRWKEFILIVTALLTFLCPIESIYAATIRLEKEKPIVIVLDPGHGGSDGGACRRWGSKNYYEKNLNLAIAKYCKSALERYSGVKVYLTRSSDYFIPLGKRVSIAKQRKQICSSAFTIMRRKIPELTGPVCTTPTVGLINK